VGVVLTNGFQLVINRLLHVLYVFRQLAVHLGLLLRKVAEFLTKQLVQLPDVLGKFCLERFKAVCQLLAVGLVGIGNLPVEIGLLVP